jgi:hypothetical protein
MSKLSEANKDKQSLKLGWSAAKTLPDGHNLHEGPISRPDPSSRASPCIGATAPKVPHWSAATVVECDVMGKADLEGRARESDVKAACFFSPPSHYALFSLCI